MEFELPRHAVSTKYAQGCVLVEWSDESRTIYNAVDLGCKWLQMSNDSFFAQYGFSFNPHSIPGLFELCKRKVYSKL